MPFTRVWNATYNSLPEDDDDALEGASRIRHTRVDVKERLEVDHHWDGDDHDGKHKKVTFRASAADPSLLADEIAIYGKVVGTKTELFFKPEGADAPIQLTFTAGAPQAVPAGATFAWPAAAIPAGYLECNGQAVSRNTYAALFAAIGTEHGAGDGVNTFNVPDIMGRTIFGKEAVASRLTAAISGINGADLGAVGGSQSLQQHNHTAAVVDPGHVHGGGGTPVNAEPGGGPGYQQVNTAAAVTGISVNIGQTGAGNSGNVPPAIVLKWIIKT